MSVEAGPSGAIAIAGSFGPKFESLIYSPIDSPIGRVELENTMPYRVGMFNPVGSINLSSEPLTTEGVIAGAEAIISEARPSSSPVIPSTEFLSGPEILREANHWLGIVVRPEPVVSVPIESGPAIEQVVAALETAGLSDLSRNVATHLQPASPSAAGQAEAVYAPATQKQLIDEIVEERKLMTDPIDEKTIRTDEDEEIVQRKTFYLVDQPVLAQVLSEADQAIDKAEEEAKRLGLGSKIIGFIVAKFMPQQHEGNTGGAVKPYGVDGTIPARKEAIKAKKEFASRKEVEAIVLENRPVTIGENGQRASKEEVRTTFRERIIKPHKPREIFERRVIRKQILAANVGQRVVYHEVKPDALEVTIEDLDLAEVFPKAA